MVEQQDLGSGGRAALSQAVNGRAEELSYSNGVGT